MTTTHKFQKDITEIELPAKFTFPFNYTPHALCVMAKEQLEDMIKDHAEWSEEITRGKMFGVLIVEDKTREIKFLAAFSGLLDKKNYHNGFVPPIYDMQNPSGYFREKEAVISEINRKIEQLEKSEKYDTLKNSAKEINALWTNNLEQAKQSYKEEKAKRDELRNNPNTPQETLENLIKESCTQKNKIREIKAQAKRETTKANEELAQYKSEIDALKRHRIELSSELQTWLFREFKVLNAKGEWRDMVEIFEKTAQRVPPAGSGECCAPKLMHYAYSNALKPIAMAEFWKGASPEGEIRVEGEYYPACKAKCHPILGFMLQGLEMDSDPMDGVGEEINSLEVIYKDSDMMVINKPSGLLSTPGKSSKASVESLIKKLYPEIENPKLVHRLDQATSGILVIALNDEAHKLIQKQFIERTLTKNYIALLDGLITESEGVISLPLALDYAHRPLQKVDYKEGKEAITRFKVLERREDKKTLVRFFPLTGRTHQLRIHSAHPQGLNTPIVGDALYGKREERLHLHAEFLRLTHPRTSRTMKFFAPCPF